MDTESDLSIVIPNHKEKNMEWTYSYCKYFFPNSQVIVVNDEKGRGKGWAVREGLKLATNTNIVFLDGDLDIHPREIKKLIPYLETNDVVVGVKQVNYPFLHRRIISLVSRKIINLLFHIPVTDTQTGIKLFKRKALSLWKTNGYLFDVEVLYRAYKRGYRIAEVPVIVTISKVKGLKVLIKTLIELICLKGRLWLKV